MARLQVTIEGSAKGLSQAFKEASGSVASATHKINKSLAVSKGELDAWDAAARRNSMEQYSASLRKAKPSVDQLSSAFKNLNRELSLSSKPGFSFGVGDAPNRLAGLNKNLQGVTKSYRGANGVAIEFSRIIQDAPYGIQGVANNIQQLGTQLTYQARAAGGFGKALTASLSSLVSPMGLALIGISAVTVGWQLYSKHANKAKKENDDTKKSFDDLIGSLDAVQASLAKGEADSQKQITRLEILYNTTQDASIAIDTRRKAVEELKKQFPSYFGGLKTETILAGQAKGAYDQLTGAILATAQARAAADRIAEGAKTQLMNRIEIEQQQEQLNLLNDKIAKAKDYINAVGQIGSAGAAGLSVAATKEAASIEKERDRIAGEINAKAIENAKIGDQNAKLAGEITGRIKDGASATLDFSDNIEKVGKSLDKTEDKFKNILSPFEQSLKNSLDHLSKIRGELNAIYGKDEFDPFDLGGVWRKPVQQTGGEVRPVGYIDMKDAGNPVKKADEFSRTMSRAIDRAGRDFYRTMSTLSTLSDATFGGIFATITEGMNEAMSEVFLGQMTDMLKKGIQEGTAGLGSALSSQLTMALAGIGVLGGIVSGLGSKDKPNYGAKIAGGALQAGAAGAMIGSLLGPGGTLIGGVVGGLVGAVGGLFGGKKREKELEEQKKQTDELKKQTMIMERQNALSYMSSIIGRYVQGQGVINQVELNEFGQLVAKVEGQDLLFVTERAKRSSRRGS